MRAYNRNVMIGSTQNGAATSLFPLRENMNRDGERQERERKREKERERKRWMGFSIGTFGCAVSGCVEPLAFPLQVEPGQTSPQHTHFGPSEQGQTGPNRTRQTLRYYLFCKGFSHHLALAIVCILIHQDT